MRFRAGDIVRHKPSGETWTIAYHEGDWVAWVGWPPGEAKAGDCELVESATDAEHREWLEKWANQKYCDPWDRRADVARRRLFELNEGFVGAGI